ncbi:hypothetical protein [Haloferula sargassicola]|uniref:Uncharacterized protein n=1 Tax=Haloferula sargassicola TaxID=490096 RepID=A0ABP9UQD3_9BACT
MRIHPSPLRAALALCAPALCLADPILTTPGTATWETITTDTGSRTVFTITDDTIFEWGELDLSDGSEMVFDFIGGNQVLNYLLGGGSYHLDGTVTSNGSVSFIAPDANLFVDGQITAEAVTLSTLDIDAADLLDGNGFELGGSGDGGLVMINGGVHATNGDVLVAGRQVVASRNSSITASGAARWVGSDHAVMGASGPERVSGLGNEGFVLHLGSTNAARIELKASSEIHNGGTLDAGAGQIFVEVGSDGVLRESSGAIVVSDSALHGFEAAPEVKLDDFDAPSVVSDSTLKVPTLRRPDGTRIAAAKEVRTSTAVSASSSVSQTGKRRAEPEKKALMVRSSFWGMRGGRGGNLSNPQPQLEAKR